MRTAELERRTGVDRNTLRFYERRGLLVGIRRTRNNYRDYPESVESEVNWIRRLQGLGFSLREVHQVLQAMRTGDMDCTKGAQLMADKRALIDARIHELRQARETLTLEQRRLENCAPGA